MASYDARKFSKLWNLDDDNESEVVVDYTMTPVIPAQTYGPAENCYPAEGGEVEIQSVTIFGSDNTVTLTDAQETELVDYLQQNTDFDDER